MAHAYHPETWTLLCDPSRRLREEDASYGKHVIDTLRFGLMCFVGALAGFTHAFVAWFTPFVAEEIVVELSAVVEEKREKGYWPHPEQYYAFRPWVWIWYLDGLEHVKFSGGSYLNHGRFACWASGQLVIAAICAWVHALVPFLLPAVGEDIADQLGRLVRNRRMLRNTSADGTFKNPQNLDDYLGSEYEKKFRDAERRARAGDQVGTGKEGRLQESKIKIQLAPGEDARFIG